MTTVLQRLETAITAELAAERTAEQAERDRRQTWWNTTWALADVPSAPRPQLTQAINRYCEMTGHSRDHASDRRKAGETFRGFETPELPKGRLAMLAAQNGGTIEDLMHAETTGMSLREFHTYLTGNRWSDERPTTATEAIRDAVRDHGAEAVADAIRTDAPAVADEIVRTPYVPPVPSPDPEPANHRSQVVMEIERHSRTIIHSMGMIERLLSQNPDLRDDDMALSLRTTGERLVSFAAVLAGVSDADLVALLGGE